MVILFCPFLFFHPSMIPLQKPMSDLRSPIAYQYSSMEALAQGMYDGKQTIAQLKKQGNFGLGTFNAMDGEMIALDGRFYRMSSNGRLEQVSDEDFTPFAIVTHFQPKQNILLGPVTNFTSLQERLQKHLNQKHIWFIRIDGSFPEIKTRSVIKQLKPYPMLEDVLKKQHIFTYQQIEGTLVGIYKPHPVNEPAFHFHFISHDKKAGGHVLDVRIQHGILSMDTKQTLQIEFQPSQLMNMMSFTRTFD